MFERLEPGLCRNNVDRLDRANYAMLLKQTRDTLPIADFSVLDDPDLESRRFAIIRHDIDMRPGDAIPIAEIEQSLGVRAVYMVLLTSEFYNLFDSANRNALRRIDELGHEVALHFDAAHHGIAEEGDLTAALRRESGMLSDLIGKPMKTFSFHNTTPFTMSCRDARYAGLYNVYAGRLQDDVSYVSDSNGMWRFESWREWLEKQPERLQVLTHPEFWQETSARPTMRVAALISEDARGRWRGYYDLLAGAGRILDCDNPEALALLADTGDASAFAIMLDWASGREYAALAELAAALADIAPGNNSIGDLRQVLTQLSKGKAVAAERRANAFVSGARAYASAVR